MMDIPYDKLNGNSISKSDPQVRKWDKRFLQMALTIAEWSKDPSRKVGAVIVDPENRIVSLGYNGFARGVDDSEERYLDKPTKYDMVVHAEVNAIISARRDVSGMVLYSTLYPCSRCAAILINAGIKKVISLREEGTFDNTAHSFQLTDCQFKEAGVKVVLYDRNEMVDMV